MNETPEIPDEFMENASAIYEVAKNLPFQVWLQMMTPLYEKQAEKLRLEGWISAQERPTDESW
jgi:hypothetical protein